MYGLLMENFASYLRFRYGDDAWDQVRRLANIDTPTFAVHKVYPESVMSRMAKKTFQYLGIKDSDFLQGMGKYFVNQFLGDYGYADVLALLGRDLRDFLNGLDNLHEYLKFSYPRIRAPSYFCDSESPEGLLLHYRSKRRGFMHYTIGHLYSVADTIYNLDLKIDVLTQEVKFDTTYVVFRLTFKNSSNDRESSALIREEARLPAVSSSILFELFPFVIVFDHDMIIQTVGKSLMQILPQLPGQRMNKFFDLTRPLIEFEFDNVLKRQNNFFEIQTIEPIDLLLKGQQSTGDEDIGGIILDEQDSSLHLKGQMMFMAEWNVIIFLCSPGLLNLDGLAFCGLFINDMALHDFSRDLLLANNKQSHDLKEALEAEMDKTREMEDSMRMLDEELKMSDDILSQMIPLSLANVINNKNEQFHHVASEAFDSVTLLVSDLPHFSAIATKCTGTQVVEMLNYMFALFETLTERNEIYKVDVLKDTFVGLAGAPLRIKEHAEHIADMALDMQDAVSYIQDPRPAFKYREDRHVALRVACHSGRVVAGIVGNKMPRYCVFGETMSITHRMTSQGYDNKVLISEATARLLPSGYVTKDHEKLDVKAKDGEIASYWLESRIGRKKLTKDEIDSCFQLVSSKGGEEKSNTVLK